MSRADEPRRRSASARSQKVAAIPQYVERATLLELAKYHLDSKFRDTEEPGCLRRTERQARHLAITSQYDGDQALTRRTAGPSAHVRTALDVGTVRRWRRIV